MKSVQESRKMAKIFNNTIQLHYIHTYNNTIPAAFLVSVVLTGDLSPAAFTIQSGKSRFFSNGDAVSVLFSSSFDSFVGVLGGFAL